MKIEYLVDIIGRDLPVAQTVRRFGTPGLTCAITPTFVADGEKRWTLPRSMNFSADVLVTPWYNAGRTLEILARARIAGARLVHYPSEQFFSRLFEAEKFNTSHTAAYRRHVDAVFVWGEYYARRLVEEIDYPPERIYEVGSPRLEFVRSDNPRQTEPKDKSVRVLFISDFTLADLRHPRQRRRFRQTYGVPFSEDALRQLRDERRYMINTAQHLAGMTGFQVRLRPHPGEQTQIYHDVCGNGCLQFADPARPFAEDVRWSDVVVGYTSTSIFEVTASCRPFLSLRCNATPPEIVRREGLEPLYAVCTREDLIEILNRPAALQKIQQRVMAEAAFYIGNIDGRYDPVTALCSALKRVQRYGAGMDLSGSDSVMAFWGGLRSFGKYLGLRLFTSGGWHRLGLWQPKVVQRRQSPGHCLTDAILTEYENSAETDHGASATEPEWSLGRWCWLPSHRAEHARYSQ